MWASLQRVLWGLAIGIPAGAGLALLAGLSRVGDDLVDANVQMLRFVPIIALQPLLIVWLGIGETVKVFLIVTGVAFPIYVNTSAAIRSIDPGLRRLCDVVGLSRWQLIRRVDTLFSNQQAAFEALSPALQAFPRTLTAVHNGRSQFKGILDHVGEGKWEGNSFTTLEPVEHLVASTHPETVAETLFVNPGFTSHIIRLTRDKSTALLADLYAHSVLDRFVVRYQWRQGDIGFWDIRASQHSVVGDFGGQHRVIQRVTLCGDAPR